MDGEEFFDRLYRNYYVPFPCYALLDETGSLAAEPADDGTVALVLVTDDDLVRRFDADGAAGRHLPVILPTPGHLVRFVGELPDRFTHVTFDPNPWFHRRYPLSVLRRSLRKAVAAPAGE